MFKVVLVLLCTIPNLSWASVLFSQFENKAKKMAELGQVISSEELAVELCSSVKFLMQFQRTNCDKEIRKSKERSVYETAKAICSSDWYPLNLMPSLSGSECYKASAILIRDEKLRNKLKEADFLVRSKNSSPGPLDFLREYEATFAEASRTSMQSQQAPGATLEATR